ncbi:MAG: RDD family protein [Actinomycetota bacterium]
MASPYEAPDPTAVMWRRVLAGLIDAALILVPAFLLVTAEFEYHTVDALTISGTTGEQFCDRQIDEGNFCVDMTEVESVEAVYFAEEISPTATIYYWGGTLAMLVILQGLTGFTIGKLLTGVRAVREDGRPPGLAKAFVRWFLWIVDAFPYFIPLLGPIVALTTQGHRRVGDMVAKTFVVRRSAAGAPIAVPGLTAAPSIAVPYSTTGPWAGPSEAPADPGAAGWADPGVGGAPAPPPPQAGGPQWDAARNTYIQWDPAQARWLQWDEAARSWSTIPEQ